MPVTYIYRDVKGKTEYIRQAVDFLTLSHHITEQRGKQGSRQIRSVKPYRDPFPTLSQPVPEFPVTPFPVVPPPLGGNGEGNPDPELLDDYYESLAASMEEAGEFA